MSISTMYSLYTLERYNQAGNVYTYLKFAKIRLKKRSMHKFRTHFQS